MRWRTATSSDSAVQFGLEMESRTNMIDPAVPAVQGQGHELGILERGHEQVIGPDARGGTARRERGLPQPVGLGAKLNRIFPGRRGARAAGAPELRPPQRRRGGASRARKRRGQQESVELHRQVWPMQAAK